MSIELLQKEELLLTSKQATIHAFKDRLDDDKILKILKHLDLSYQQSLTLEKTPESDDGRFLEATGGMIMIGIYGRVTCELTNKPYKFSESAWGLGGAGFSSLGTIFNVYEPSNWDAFFRNTRSYHAQGFAGAAGIFQITWFDGDNDPIGQFNSVAVGAGVFQVGGKGRWQNTK